MGNPNKREAGPLPDPPDRAAAADVSERYTIPLSTVYGLMNGGELPSWKIGRKKRCTSWPAVKAFFGDRPREEPS